MPDLFASCQPNYATVSVCLPFNVDRCFDYALPDGETVPTGSYVRVPFSGKEVTGILWGEGAGDCPAHKLKPVMRVLDHLPPMSETLRRFIVKAAAYNCVSLGNMLKLAMPIMQEMQSPQEAVWVERCEPLPELRMTSARRKVLNRLPPGQAMLKRELIEAGISAAVLKGMREEGALRQYTRALHYVPPSLAPQGHVLSRVQEEAAAPMMAALDQGYHAFLLDGATGSGKTEVFCEVVEAVIRSGQQAVILVPEIALTLQLVNRAARRFGIEPTIWHSSQTPARRRDALQQIIHGGTQLIIGARSALFLPYASPGVIVVDEEHDGSFKQEDGAMYHGRDMAVLRAREEQIPVILTSATPSLETLHNASQGKYHHIRIERRLGQAELPAIEVIDMRKQKLERDSWLSPPLRERLSETLAAAQQALLFINRRGYAPLVLCRGCGHRYECPNCSAWLVYHASKAQLCCHHCGLEMPLPPACPSCDAPPEKMAVCGPGVERIEEEVRALFPQARCCVLSGEMSHQPGAMDAALAQISSGEVDIIIGTQLLAKGHHFPGLAMVGVVDADTGLQGGDPRGAEKTYQLLHQLAGRAGRESRRGEVYLQSYQPDHPLLDALRDWDRDRFVALELENRAMTGMPPYGRLAALIVEGKPEALAEEIVCALQRAMPVMEGVTILGPAPAPLYKLRNLYRHRFLVMAPKRVALQPVMRDWRAQVKLPSTVSVKIDIDPVSFM